MTTSRWHSSESPIDGHALVALLAPVAANVKLAVPLGFARLSIEESTGDGFLQAAHEIDQLACVEALLREIGVGPDLQAAQIGHSGYAEEGRSCISRSKACYHRSC